MTQFQSLFINECRKLLDKHARGESVFKEMAGKTEIYYVASLDLSKNKIDIYVYGCEAGFMVNGEDWHAFERAAFQSDNQLIKTLIEELAGYM